MTEKIYYKILKDADKETVDDIISLYKSAGWWTEDSTPEIIPDMVKGSFIFLAAVNEKGRLVGMGRAISDGVSDAYIQDMAVLKELRGTGIGREIVSTLASLCIKSGILWLGLIAEPGTDTFYKTLGFKPLEGYIPLKYSVD